jgi:hypothetical protein
MNTGNSSFEQLYGTVLGAFVAKYPTTTEVDRQYVVDTAMAVTVLAWNKLNHHSTPDTWPCYKVDHATKLRIDAILEDFHHMAATDHSQMLGELPEDYNNPNQAEFPFERPACTQDEFRERYLKSTKKR